MNISNTTTLSDVTYANDEAIKLIIEKDIQSGFVCNPNSQNYVRNFDTYNLAINLWCNMGLDLGQTKFVEYLYSHMLRYGLIKTIQLTTRSATNLRKSGINGDRFVNLYWRNRHIDEPVSEFHDQLQFLDFLKRFSVEYADVTDDRSIQALFDLDRRELCKFWPEGHDKFYTRLSGLLIVGNHACDTMFHVEHRRLNEHGYQVDVNPRWIESIGARTSHWLPYLAFAMDQVFPKDADARMYTNTPHRHGPGAVQDACTSLMCKRLHETRMYAGCNTIGTSVPRDYWVEPMPVPKSYSVSRVIAPMPTLAQSEGYALADAMIEFTKTHDIKIGPYTYKQSECILLDPDNTVEVINGKTIYHNPSHRALFDPRCATIDMTSASDTVRKFHIRLLLKTRFGEKLVANMPKHWRYKGKLREMKMAWPMGSACTFPVENRVFFAVCVAAYDIHYLFNPDSEELLHPIVFGDDIIVDVRVYDLVLELLENFGFIPNREKSFGDVNHRYRESCGRHVYNDVDVTCLYFPRHPMNMDSMDDTHYDSWGKEWTSTASALLKLNNLVYTIREDKHLKYGYMLAFMQQYIRTRWPETIFIDPSLPFADDDCLWGAEVKYPTIDLLTGEQSDLMPLEMLDEDGNFRPSLRVYCTKVGTKKMQSCIRKKVSAQKPCPHETLNLSVTEFVENLVYEDYLLDGPIYKDDRDRDLGVSTRRNRGSYTEKPVLTFTRKRI